MTDYPNATSIDSEHPTRHYLDSDEGQQTVRQCAAYARREMVDGPVEYTVADRLSAALRDATQTDGPEPPYVVPVSLWEQIRQGIIDSNHEVMIELVAQVERANVVPEREMDQA